MPKRKANATKGSATATEPSDVVQASSSRQRQTGRPSSSGTTTAKSSTPGLLPGRRQRSRPGVPDSTSTNSTSTAPSAGPAAAVNKGDDVVPTGSPDRSQVKGQTSARAKPAGVQDTTGGNVGAEKPVKPAVAAKRGRAARSPPVKRAAVKASEPEKEASESPSRSRPTSGGVDDSTATAEPPVKTGKRGRAVRGTPKGTPAKRASAKVSEPEKETSGSPSRSKPTGAGANDSTVTAEPTLKTGKRGRTATLQAVVAKTKGERDTESLDHSPSAHSAGALAKADDRAGASKLTGKQASKRGRADTSKAGAVVLQQRARQDPPAERGAADAPNTGQEDSESQNLLQPKRKSSARSRQPGATANAGKGADASNLTAKNSKKPAKGTKRGREPALGPDMSEPQQLEEQGPPAKRTMAKVSSGGEKSQAQGATRAGPSKQLGPVAVPSTSTGRMAATTDKSGRGAKKPSVASKGPEVQNKKLSAKGQTAASNSTVKQNKTAAKGSPQSKPKQRKRKDSDASDSSYVVPHGLLQRPKRRDFLYYEYIRPRVEQELWNDSDSDDEDISDASISSIIPPAGLLQPYRTKNRLIGAGGSSSSSDTEDDDDMPVSPGEDLLSRCKAKFGANTLPHSTTTTAEAISMLVNFASSRRLPWGALSELVTIVNKFFAPAADVLPGRKALAEALSEMP